MTRMKYRGSYPSPKYEHGEIIPGIGKVLSRTRIRTGWEYGCKSEACSGTLRVSMDDQQKKYGCDKMTDAQMLDQLMFWLRVGRNEDGLKGGEKKFFKSLCDEIRGRGLLKGKIEHLDVR